jgi:nitroreductase
MSPTQFLSARLSTPSRNLTGPGPDDAQLAELLRIAVRVPDHGKLTPWRLVRIAGDARRKLGARLVDIQRKRHANVDPAALEKDAARFNFAPLILAVIARLTAGHKVPEQEQLLSAGCVAYNLLLGAQALGFGAQWLTGWAAYDADVAQALGLSANERIVGFIHIGTIAEAAPERARPDPLTVLSDAPL